MRQAFLLLLFFSFTSFSNVFDVSFEHGKYINESVPLSQLLPSPYDPGAFELLIQKSSYTLFVKYNGRVIKSFPCVFGENPYNDKLCQGDKCTPEGNFRINAIRYHDLWGYFLAFDYPNSESWNKHNMAKNFGIIPPYADIGGSVGIHGVVEGLDDYIDDKRNWTEGCVSIKNVHVTDLARHISVGTPVKIFY